MAAFRLHRLDLAVEQLGALRRVVCVVADAVVVSAVVVVVDGAAAVRSGPEVEEPDVIRLMEATPALGDRVARWLGQTVAVLTGSFKILAVLVIQGIAKTGFL